MNIQFHGHACLQVTHEGQSFIIDPFISGNPLATTQVKDVRVSHVLLTHGHQDHILDAAEIARANDATILATVELATFLGWQGVKTAGMNLGGTAHLPFGSVKLTHAFHSSGYVFDDKQQIVYLGMPGGLLINVGGKTLYHAGDTGLFGDMKMIGERNDIDVAFLPIGDWFTMGPDDALQAAKWLGAKLVIPIHYNTFPPIRQDGALFVQRLKEAGLEGKVLEPGESIQL